VTDGYRINLTESNDGHYSVMAAVKAGYPSGKWRFLNIAMHPKNQGYEWCAEHVSPCAILSSDFINHKGLLLGIMSGREKTEVKNGKKFYRKFRPGLFLFNPKTGEIPWVSPEPLFEDPDAETITFASDFVELNENEGLLYAHVNDSFVRVYKIAKHGLEERLRGIKL